MAQGQGSPTCISHGIRARMRSIVQMAARLSENPLTPEEQRFVQNMRQASEHLLGQIADLDEFFTLNAGRWDLKEVEFDLHEIIHELIAQAYPRLRENGIELICEMQPAPAVSLLGDPARLSQFLFCLLRTAIQATEAGEEIVLRVEQGADLHETGCLRFSICHPGLGISPQLPSGTPALGVAIARNLAELMKGTFWIENIIGEGTTYYFAGRFGIPSEPHKRASIAQTESGIAASQINPVRAA